MVMSRTHSTSIDALKPVHTVSLLVIIHVYSACFICSCHQSWFDGLGQFILCPQVLSTRGYLLGSRMRITIYVMICGIGAW